MSKQCEYSEFGQGFRMIPSRSPFWDYSQHSLKTLDNIPIIVSLTGLPDELFGTFKKTSNGIKNCLP